MKTKRIAFNQDKVRDYLFYLWCVEQGLVGTAAAIKTNLEAQDESNN